MGYSRAGFDVVGVDLKQQRRYPFKFHQCDALEFLREHGYRFDAIHASPPCQRYCTLTPKNARESHPDLVAATRALLKRLGKPYVIENVEGAPLNKAATRLCGSMFGLRLRRHRRFETSFAVIGPPCAHHKELATVGVWGHPGGSSNRSGKTLASLDDWKEAMGIEWMTAAQLSQAIPPAYTEWIGKRLLRVTSPPPSPASGDTA